MARMKAMVLDAPGSPLRLCESDLPSPAPNDVLVKIAAPRVGKSEGAIALTSLGTTRPGR